MIKYLLSLSLILSSVISIKLPIKDIELTLENSLIIRGEINEKSTKLFLSELYSKDNKTDLYLFLDTPGGSVMNGLKIIDEIEKHGISCIVNKAYSMGFVILQYCKNRYIMKHATIMQHQISYSVQGEKAKIESMVNYIKSISNELTNKQASRIGINKSDFEIKTYNDWWLYGNNIIKEGCADEIIIVYCSDELVNSYYNITLYDLFSEYTISYSRCGLL